MSVSFSFLPGEIIPPGTKLKISSSRRIEEHSARQNIVLSNLKDGHERDCLTICDDAVEISTNSLLPGIYGVAIDPLHDADGHCINPHPVSESFRIRPLCGRVPEDHAVIHAVHFGVGEIDAVNLQPGQEASKGTVYLEKVIAVNRNTLASTTFSFDAEGRPLDAEKVLNDLRQRRFAKFGKLQEHLWKKLEGASEEELHEVAIWPVMDHDHVTFYDPALPSAQRDELAAKARRHAQSAFQRPKGELIRVLDELGVDCPHDDISPDVIANLTKRQIQQVAELDVVVKIYEVSKHSQTQQASAGGDIKSHQLTTHRAYEAHSMGCKGEGINVAIHEKGYNNTTDLDVLFENIFLWEPPPPKPTDNKEHYRSTTAIVRNSYRANRGDVQHNGFAPECTIWWANDDQLTGLNWAVLKGCTIISESFMHARHLLSYELSDYDKRCDYLATAEPFPLIVRAAGNRGMYSLDGDPHHLEMIEVEDGYTAPKGWNGMCIGSHAPDCEKISSFSMYRNPEASDRELPDLCASGENIEILGRYAGQGTSLSAPAVAGIAALVQACYPGLEKLPEACRAILYASAGRRAEPWNGTWHDTIRRENDNGTPNPGRKDLRGGAGIVDAEAACKIARSVSLVATRKSVRGWSYGTLDGSKFEPIFNVSKFHYKIITPKWVTTSSIIVRAALVFSTSVVEEFADLVPEYDLRVDDDETLAVVGFSASFQNSYEIVEFTAKSNHVYRIHVTHHGGHRLPPPDKTTRFGIAWACFRDGRIC